MLLEYKNQQLSAMEKLIAKSEFGGEKYDDILLNNRNKKSPSQCNCKFQKVEIPSN